MSDLNMVQLIGRLGADPEVRRNNDGDPIVNLRIATSESWKDKNTGDRKEKTEWHNVVIFGGIAKVAEKYLNKGSKVYLQGQLKTRKWQDRDGNDRYSTEVVLDGFHGNLIMLDSRDRDGGGGGRDRDDDRRGRDDDRRDNRGNDRGRGNDDRGGSRGGSGGGGFSQELNDEIPFAPQWK